MSSIVRDSLFAPEARDGAEAARAVAAFGHLHIGPGRRRLGPRKAQQVDLGHGRPVTECDRYGVGEPGRRRRSRAWHSASSAPYRSARHPVTTKRAPSLRGAGHPEDRLDRLLPRLFDERAGVDHDEVGFIGRVGRHQAVRDERARELVGVDLVLGTAEGLDPEPARHRPTRVLVRYRPYRAQAW